MHLFWSAVLWGFGDFEKGTRNATPVMPKLSNSVITGLVPVIHGADSTF